MTRGSPKIPTEMLATVLLAKEVLVDRLKQACGNWVDGDRFWDRDDDIGLVTERLRDGANILLVAQRRMGKTSLMREIGRRLNDDYVVLFVDLQKSLSAPMRLWN